jgi:hypothetical protein
MITGLTSKYRGEDVAHVLDEQGFAGTYDLLYMPCFQNSKKTKHPQNMGYAFVNFKHPDSATTFLADFQSVSSCSSTGSKKPFSVRPARLQGYRVHAEMHATRTRGVLFTYE